MGDLDWNDCRYFLAAARTRSLAGAARGLGVKHSTVGRRLAALERALGGVLFMRGPDGLRLTPLGERILPLAQEVERAMAALSGQARAQVSNVRLALPSGLVPQFTPFLERLRQSHPEISLDFVSGSRRADLSSNEADLAVRIGATGDDDKLIARKVGEVGWSVYASADYIARNKPLADPKQLAGHRVLGFDASLADVPGAKWLAQYGAGATVVLLHRELADMAAAAVGGMGLALLPCVLADGEPRLQRLSSQVLGRQRLSLLYRREALQAQPVEIVARFVVDVLRERAKVLSG